MSTTIEKHRLGVSTPSEREIVLKRTFDAPRDLVWQAVTKPEHVAKWYGCDESTVAVCEIDLRVGGAWRYVIRMAQGEEFGFHGVYNEIIEPKKIVSTEVFEPMPDFESLNTMVLEEREGRTTLTTTVLHGSPEARDGHLNSGMEVGAGQSFDRLEDLLQSLTV